MNMRVVSSVTGFMVATFVAASATAQSGVQPWLGDRRMEGGIGIRVGDFELHPGVAGELGYDTNYFQSAGIVTPPGTAATIPVEFRPVEPDGVVFGASGTFNEPIVGTFRFRITPSLTLETLGAQRREGDDADAAPPKVNLRATLAASYNELIATDARYSGPVSDRRFLAADVGVAVDVLPGRPWSVGFTGLYNRSVQPVNDPAAPPGYERSTFGAGTALTWSPGGGMLEWSLGYDFTYILFEDDAFTNFNSVGHDVGLRGRWLFFPRTAILYTGDFGVVDYPEGGTVKPTGAPLSSKLGINGLITNHFGLLIFGGWKTFFFTERQEFDSFIANAELTWYPLPRPDLAPEAAGVGLSAISVGYRRDAKPSYLGNFVQIDGGFARGSYFFGGTVLASIEASFDHLQRPPSYFSDLSQQTSAFSENRVTATAFAEYRTSDTFGINTTLRYSGALTDRLVPLDSDATMTTIPYDDLGFNRFEAWLGVRWFL
jgi:hypothetical protein